MNRHEIRVNSLLFGSSNEEENWRIEETRGTYGGPGAQLRARCTPVRKGACRCRDRREESEPRRGARWSGGECQLG